MEQNHDTKTFLYKLIDRVLLKESYSSEEAEDFYNSPLINDKNFWLGYLVEWHHLDQINSFESSVLETVAALQRKRFIDGLEPHNWPEHIPGFDELPERIDISDPPTAPPKILAIKDVLQIHFPRIRVEKSESPNLYYRHEGRRDESGGDRIETHERDYKPVGIAIIEERKAITKAFVKWHVVSLPLDSPKIPTNKDIPFDVDASLQDITVSHHPYKSEGEPFLVRPAERAFFLDHHFTESPPKKVINEKLSWQYILQSSLDVFQKTLNEAASPADPSEYFLRRSFFFLTSMEDYDGDQLEKALRELAVEIGTTGGEKLGEMATKLPGAGSVAGKMAASLIEILWPEGPDERPLDLLIDLEPTGVSFGPKELVPIFFYSSPGIPPRTEIDSEGLWVKGTVESRISRIQFLIELAEHWNNMRVPYPVGVHVNFELLGQMRLKVIRIASLSPR